METPNKFTPTEIDDMFKKLGLETPEMRQAFNFSFSPAAPQKTFAITVNTNSQGTRSLNTPQDAKSK